MDCLILMLSSSGLSLTPRLTNVDRFILNSATSQLQIFHLILTVAKPAKTFV